MPPDAYQAKSTFGFAIMGSGHMLFWCLVYHLIQSIKINLKSTLSFLHYYISILSILALVALYFFYSKEPLPEPVDESGTTRGHFLLRMTGITSFILLLCLVMFVVNLVISIKERQNEKSSI